MTTKKTSTKRPAEGKADAEELKAFAHHLAEVLRIARKNDCITSRFYNDLYDAWNNFQNDTDMLSELYESEDYINLTLANFVSRVAAHGKGGAE